MIAARTVGYVEGRRVSLHVESAPTITRRTPEQERAAKAKRKAARAARKRGRR